MPVVRRFLAEGKEITAYDEKHNSYALKWLQNQIQKDCGIAVEQANKLLFDVEYWKTGAYKNDKRFKSRLLVLMKGFQKHEDSTSPWRAPNMGSYTADDCEYRYAFLKNVANGAIDLDWLKCGLPCVRNMEKNPRKVDKPEPIVDEMLMEALIWAKLEPEPANGLFACCFPTGSKYTLLEYDSILNGVYNVKFAIKSGFRAGKHYDKDYSVRSPCKGVGLVEGSSLLDLYCRAVTTSMDGYGDVIAEASDTRRKAAAAFDEKYCKGTDGVWRSKEAETERLKRFG